MALPPTPPQQTPSAKSSLSLLHLQSGIMSNHSHASSTHHYHHQQNNEAAAIAAAAARGARMVHRQMTPPQMESGRRAIFSNIQVPLCLLGAFCCVGISVWMVLCSNEAPSHKAGISSVSGICALIFLLTAFVTFQRRKRKAVGDIEINPAILREHHRSLCNSMRKSTGTASAEPYIQQIRRHSVEIAADSVRQLLTAQQQQHVVAKSSGNLLTVVGRDATAAAGGAEKLGRKRAGSAYN